MDKWSILGISPTEDITVIKKAYAKMLRKYHPEEDSEEFQQLREAYESALQYSKWSRMKDSLQSENIITTADEALGATEIQRQEYIDFVENVVPKTLSIEELNEEFINRVENLYNNFILRIDIKNWEALLDCDVIWDISNRESLSYKMLNFLHSHHYLPKNVWKLLDENFNWSSQEDFFYEYPDELITYIVKQIKQTRPLSYSYFKEVDGVDYETYLGYREKAFTALQENSMDIAYENIVLVKEIYQGDCELLRLEGEYHMEIGEIDNASSIFNRLLSIIPDHVEGCFSRASIYYKKGQFQQAIEDCLQIRHHMHENPDIPLILAKSYYSLKDFAKAREYFEKVLEAKPNDYVTVNYLIDTNIKFRRRFQRKLIADPGNKHLREQLNSIRKELKEYKHVRRKAGISEGVTHNGLYHWMILIFAIFSIVSYYSADNNIISVLQNKTILLVIPFISHLFLPVQ